MHTDRSETRTGFRAVWTSSPDAAAGTVVAAAALDTINWISQAIVPSCRTCVCTLLCYWNPTDDLCKSCLEQAQLASLFLHHQHCPQGSVYSFSSSTCYEAFISKKIWSQASRHCQNSGGHLAQPRDKRSIQEVLEAINLQATSEDFWIGAKERVETTGAGISGSAGTRISGISMNNQGSRSTGQGKPTLFWKISKDFIDNGNQKERRDHIRDHRKHREHSAQVKRNGVDSSTISTFLWTSDSSPVESGNWAEGYPVPGIVTLNVVIVSLLIVRHFWDRTTLYCRQHHTQIHLVTKLS